MEASPQEVRAETQEKGRVDAFSDGVLAIAITLLVLEIRLPAGEHEGELLNLLLAEWPSYFAYVVSFLTIGVMWVNHSDLFRMLRRVDRSLLMLNALLLMAITFLNFPTVILSEAIQTPDINVAAVFYSGTTLVIAVAYNAIWVYARRHPYLFEKHVTPGVIQGVTRQFNIGFTLYVMAFIVAFFSGILSVLLCFGLAVFFALPVRNSNFLRGEA
jgi:uncharacterized membrane protein